MKKPKTAMNQLSTPEELARLRKHADIEDESLLSVGGLVSKIEEAERRWDVVIYKFKTRIIESVGGTDLPETDSFHTVSKRLDTVLDHINIEHYGVLAVPAGKFKKGDVLPMNVETYVG